MSLKEKSWSRSNEPIFWGLFAAGGMLAAFITPTAILLTGILVPLGVFRQALAYETVLAFVQTWYGKLILWSTIGLPFWHAVHRIVHSMADLGLAKGQALLKWVWYVWAAAILLTSAIYLIRLG